jgi:hypothetical protein
VGLRLSDTAHVLRALWLNTSEVSATNIDQLKQEGVSDNLRSWEN